MAGDWIKIEHGTPDKPEVLAIAAKLQITPAKAFVLLFRFWCWLDTNSVDGSVTLLSRDALDSVLNCSGFSMALAEVNWLRIRDDGIIARVPHFSYHNGKSAKTRAVNAKRQQVRRERSQALQDTLQQRDGERDNSVTREDSKSFTLTHNADKAGITGTVASATKPDVNGNGSRRRRPREHGTNPRAVGTNPRAVVAPDGVTVPRAWWLSEAATTALAVALGLPAQRGEDWPTLRARLRAELDRRRRN